MSGDFFFWLLGFAALVLYALVFAERGVHTAAAPFAAVCGGILLVTLFGCFGMLRVGALVFLLGSLAALGWLAWRWVFSGHKVPRFTLGFWLFLAVGIGGALLLAVKQPEFSDWDEFSFWATSQKLARLYNEFHTTAPAGFGWPVTQVPGLTAVGYLLSYLCRGFAAWQVYASVNVLMFACVAALASALPRKNWNITLPVFLVGLLTPYLFVHYYTAAKISMVYLSSLGDVPMGMVFAAALALAATGSPRKARGLVPLCLGVATLTLMKDQMGLLLGLVVAGVTLCLLLFSARGQGTKLSRHVGRAFGRFGILAASAVLPYIGWSAYLGTLMDIDRTSLGGRENISLADIPGRFFGDLAAGGDAHFNQTLAGMKDMFFTRTTLLGSGAVVVAVILALLAFAALITKEKPLRRRCIVYGAATTAGFALYYLALTLSYAYLFREDQLLVDYERYIYPYYIGWFLGAVALLALCARHSRLVAEGKLALVALAALCTLRVWQFVPLQYTVMGVDSSEYSVQRGFAQEAAAVAQHMDGDDLLFIVTQQQDGLRWFKFLYELLPYQVDYSFGGTQMVERTQRDDGSFHERVVTPDYWAEYINEKGITMVLLDYAHDDFYETYGHLFADGGESRLYRVAFTGGTLQLEPVA